MEKRYWIKDGFLIFKDEAVLPEEGQLTYVPYGLKGIVLPLLERPADVNRLYKGINAGKPWKSPDIYYKGSYRQCQELEKRFGISELHDRSHHVSVYPWGKAYDNPKPVTKGGKHFEYISYWDFDSSGIPQFLSDRQIMNSALLPDEISTTEIRLITGPNTAVYRPVRIGDEDYAQVCLHSPQCLDSLRYLCQYREGQRLLLIEHGVDSNDDILYEVSVADGSRKPISAVIDDSAAEKDGYRSFLAMGAEYDRHREMIDYVNSRKAGKDVK